MFSVMIWALKMVAWFLWQAMQENVVTNIILDFDWLFISYDYFDPLVSFVYFSGLFYILASQILHFSLQNVPQCPTKWSWKH